MLKSFFSTAVVLVAVLLVATAVFAEMAPQKVVDYCNNKATMVGTSAIVVGAVKAENAKGKSMAMIEDLDTQWKASKDVADFMIPYMENECAHYLGMLVTRTPEVVEIFVTDNQGANVCQTHKTGDFWQGDEAKFKKAFADGKGAIFLDEVEMDAGKRVAQCNVPVMDGDKAIGHATVVLDVDTLMK
jgi:hypothetical protein